MKRTIVLVPMLVLGACTAADSNFPEEAQDNCAPIFAQNVMPEYHVTISQDEWNKLHEEFVRARAECEQRRTGDGPASDD